MLIGPLSKTLAVNGWFNLPYWGNMVVLGRMYLWMRSSFRGIGGQYLLRGKCQYCIWNFKSEKAILLLKICNSNREILLEISACGVWTPFQFCRQQWFSFTDARKVLKLGWGLGVLLKVITLLEFQKCQMKKRSLQSYVNSDYLLNTNKKNWDLSSFDKTVL